MKTTNLVAPLVAAVLLAATPGIGVETVEFTYQKVVYEHASSGAADAAKALQAAKKCESAGKTADVEQCLMRVGFRKRIDMSTPLLAPAR